MNVLWICLCFLLGVRAKNGNSKNANGIGSVTVAKRSITLSCVTPNSDRGLCILLKECPLLLSQTTNDEAHEFLRDSKCGVGNGSNLNPYVCCGAYGNYVLPKNCGRQNVTIKSRIFGGSKAILAEFPWMVMLYHKSASGYKEFGCTGALIAPTFVLTAAHCLMSDNENILGPIWEVRLGEHNTDTRIDCNEKKTICAPKLQVIRVKETIPHPKYNPNFENHHHDIGLVHLKKSAMFTNFVYPICIPEDDSYTPYDYWVSGWGRTLKSGGSSVKIKLSLPAYSHSNCTEKYKTLQLQIIEEQICAGAQKNRDSCSGDSGGPLMMIKKPKLWYAAGVVSYGIGCGKEGWPGVYTKTSGYINWIKHTMLKKLKKIKNKKKAH